MRQTDIANLQEAYHQIYYNFDEQLQVEEVEEVEEIEEVEIDEETLCNAVLSYLIDEGYANDEKSAVAIFNSMSGEWHQSVIEDITGGTVGFRVPIGGTRNQLPGFKGVTGSVQGGSGRTQFGASGSLGSGTVSGQGDKINQGIDAALRNYQTGSNANTSTSTVRQGTMGTFNANVSGGTSRPQARPVPQPTPKPVAVKPKTPVKPSPFVEKPRQAPTAADERMMSQNTPAGAAARERQAAFNRQNAADNARNPNASSPANVQTPYQAARGRLVKAGVTDEAGNEYTGSKSYLDKQLNGTPSQASQAASLSSDLRLVGGENLRARMARSTGVDTGRLVKDPSTGQTVKVFGNNPLR